MNLCTRLVNGLFLGIAVAAATVLAGGTTYAQSTLFWSGDGTTQGGAGTWNTTLARFGTSASGPFTQVWNNANNDSAEFGGATAGSVAVSANITVNSLTFDTGGYTLAAGSTITFAGPNPTITVNVTGTANTTLSALYTGTGPITKMGTGRLELNNSSNTLSGGYIINQGFINLAAANRLGTGAANPGTLNPSWFTFGGGGLTSSNAAAQDLGSTRGVTLAGNAWLGASNSADPVTISAPITGTGDIIVAKSTTVSASNNANASPLNTTFNSGGVWILGNSGNNWVGNAQVDAGTLREGASNVIPDSAIVYMTASGTQFDLGTNNTTETVRAISGTAGTVALGTSGNLTVNVPTSETYLYTSVLSATTGGTAKVTKDGAGAWTLSGTSTGFNGQFVIQNGTLGVGGNFIFGNSGNTSSVVYNGGVLSNNGTGGRTIPAPISLAINVDMTVDDSLFNSSTPGQILFNGPSTISANRTFNINGTANLGLADLRESGGSHSIIKQGTGTLALTDATASDPNAFTGSVTVNAGRLQVSATSYVGNGTNTVNLNGGALNTSASRTVSFDNPINLMADSAITTTSTAATPNFDFGNNNPITGASKLTLRNDGGDQSTDQLRVRFFGSGFNISNNIDMPNGSTSSTVELASFNTTGTTQTFSGLITGTGDFKRSASSGGTGGTTVFTNGSNTFSGGVQLNDGTIEFDADSVGPANAPTSGPVGTGTITVNNINSPKLSAGGGARNIGNGIAFVGGSVMGITGSNALTLTGDVSLGAGSRTLLVDNTALSTMTGTFSGTGGSLTKDGAGVLKITGNNTYDTGTTVTNGTLLVSNTAGSGTGTSAVIIGATGTLGGTGTVGGAITNNGVIAPGESGTGTLSVTGNVTDAASSSWSIALSGASATKLAVTGDIDLSATDSLNITGTGTGSSWLIGTYTGTETGSFDTVTTGYSVSYSGGNITLNVAVAGLPGDFNSDGKVDAGDYSVWRKNNANVALPNDNGLTTQADRFNLWRANFGNSSGAGSGHGLGNAAVPEPTALALLVISLGMLSAGRRK